MTKYFSFPQKMSGKLSQNDICICYKQARNSLFFSVPVLHILSGNVYQPSKLCYMNYHQQLCKMKAGLHIRRFLRQIQSCSEWKSYINRAWQHKVHVRQVKAGVAKGEGARFPWYFLSTGGRWGFEHFCFMLISALLRVMMTIILIWVMVIVIVKTKNTMITMKLKINWAL